MLADSGSESDDIVGVHFGDGVGVVAEFGEDFVGVVAEQGCPGDGGGEVGEFDRASDGQVGAALFLGDFHDAAAGAQGGIVGDVVHAEHRCAGHVVFAQNVDGLVFGFVGQPGLDVGEDVEDVGGARGGGVVGGVLDPFRATDGHPGVVRVRFLDGEVDVGVGVVVPAAALEHPAGLTAAAGVAAAGNGVAEHPVGVLRGT